MDQWFDEALGWFSPERHTRTPHLPSDEKSYSIHRRLIEKILIKLFNLRPNIISLFQKKLNLSKFCSLCNL